MTTARVRAPFPWFGGKQALAPLIVSLMPQHDTYVEVFGGAAAVLFTKAPSRLEVYNDLDSELVNVFRVLRDRKRGEQLRRLLELTPYSRVEWEACAAPLPAGLDAVERARRFFVLATQGFAGRVASESRSHVSPGWRYAKLPGHNPAQSYRTNVALLPLFAARLAGVEVECADWARVLAGYDAPGTLFYCDPPYVPDARGSGGYRHEFTVEDHERLLDAVRACTGMVILSGYDTPLYREHLDGWECVRVATVSYAARVTDGGNRPKREECIWIKPNATRHQLALGWESAS